MRHGGVLLAAMVVANVAVAAGPEFTPYRPLYPALYLDAGYEHDPGDRSFDASGKRRSTVLPNESGRSEFAREELHARLAWYFPMFEQDALPFFSKRLHTARIGFRYADIESTGAIETFIEERPGLARAGGGLGDLKLEFGSFLSGSEGWREGRVGSLSTLLLFGVTLPVGIYDRESPVNSSDNQLAVQLKLGAHGAPWKGAFVDGGVGYRTHGRNEEPQFGALAPTEQGDSILWDMQLAQRVRSGLYVALSLSGSEGEANHYRDVRIATQSPTGVPGSDIAPVRGSFQDGGTDLRLAQLSLRWFVTQRFATALHFTHPFSGSSGEFDLPLQQRTPAGCAPGATGCVTQPAGSTREDGLGPARSLASDRIGLSFTFQFGQGDTWSCPGCKH